LQHYPLDGCLEDLGKIISFISTEQLSHDSGRKKAAPRSD
jgi:hypothetical protein